MVKITDELITNLAKEPKRTRAPFRWTSLGDYICARWDNLIAHDNSRDPKNPRLTIEHWRPEQWGGSRVLFIAELDWYVMDAVRCIARWLDHPNHTDDDGDCPLCKIPGSI